MKIFIPTIGSQGDIVPFIALAQGLIQAGHTVILGSHPVMKNLVESHGVTFNPIGPDIDLAEEVAAIRRQAGNTAFGLVQGMRFGFKMLERSHDDILLECQKADLVVVPAAIGAGKNEAELLNVPYLSVTFMPWAIPWDDPGRPLIKRILYKAIDGLVSLITTQPLNRIRKRQGLPPVGKEGFTSTRLNLIPISPAVYPPNPLWEPRHRVVGYWFAEPPNGWKPPKELLSFLENGDPPVLITLGAMSLGDEQAIASANLFVNAIQQAEVRGIIQGWEKGISQLDLPSNIYASEWVPHSWLIPHCSGVVHHGGYGTTAAGLRAGIPALVIPHIADQFYWGERVYELSAGLKPISRRKLDVNGLAQRLDRLVRNQEIHLNASKLGEIIRAENGIGKAVRLIEESFV